jgi:MFS family permease
LTAARTALPAGVWALGICSLLMDVSSELIHSVLPVFMTTVLGASLVTVGVVEGVAEATAAVVKVFSGVLSDALGRRKLLAVLGYGLGAASKPLFPLAGSIAWVASARFIDRIGKGIRGAPRDALLAELVPESQRGAAYGLRQALDSVGAFVGPLGAIVLLALLAGDLRTTLWVAIVPAIASVLVLVVGVQEPTPPAGQRVRSPIRRAELASLGRRYWLIVALGAVLTLARFSDAFLVLRAQSVGLALVWVPAVMVVMNVVYAATSYPAGVAADAGHRRALLGWGLAALIAADAVLAMASAPATVMAGTALWGLHMGLTQGLLSYLVANASPAALRGTAFGVFNLVTGLSLLAASVLAGMLWNMLGPAATFAAGAGFTLLAGAGLVALRPRPEPGAVDDDDKIAR